MSNEPRSEFRTTLLQKTGLVLFGIFLCLVLLESGLRIGGAIFYFLQESENLRSLRANGYRIMCLGESTTAKQYPPFLEEALNRRGKDIKFSVIDKGMPSVNTDVILEQLEVNLDKYKPDLVVVMMGINDQGLHMPQQVKGSSGFVQWLFSLRVCKLARFLRLHLTAKMQEIRTAKPSAVQAPGLSEPPAEVKGKKLKNFGLSSGQELLGVSGGRHSADEQKFLSDGWDAFSRGDQEQAEKAFNEVLAKNPRNAQAYYGLSWIYRSTNRWESVEALLLKVIELTSGDAVVYCSLGDLYLFQKKYEQAEAAYKKAEFFNNKNENVTFSLVYIYMIQKRYADAEKELKWYIEKNPKNDRCYRRLMLFYQEMGKAKEAAVYEPTVKSLDDDFYSLFTVTNYRNLKAILDRRKIKLVCVQYPMRKVSVLKKIFASSDGVFFVDNEGVFKAAVAGGHIHEYFLDMFGGDFGHCTSLGNKLLAEQIAGVVIKEVLKMR